MRLWGEYVWLRKQSCPDWVSSEALSIFNKRASIFLGDPESGEEGLAGVFDGERGTALFEQFTGLIRCFSSSDMKYSWNKVKSIYPDDPSKGQVWFAELLCHSFVHFRARRATKGQAEEWKSKLLDTLKEAYDLINHTPDNMLNWVSDAMEQLVDEMANYKCINLDKDTILVATPLPHSLIEKFIDALEKTEYDSGYYGGER